MRFFGFNVDVEFTMYIGIHVDTHVIYWIILTPPVFEVFPI